MQLKHEEIVSLAESVTLQAMQEKLIYARNDYKESAKEIADFYKAFVQEIKDRHLKHRWITCLGRHQLC